MWKLLPILALLAPLALAACGDDDRTVIIQPPERAANPTVVVPSR